MLPSPTLPMAPLLFPTGIATVLGILGVGAFVALLIGVALHRREHDTPTEMDVTSDAAETPDRTRLSA